MIKWVEDHPTTVMLAVGLIIIAEMGVGCWRMPKEFRSSIIPKLNQQIGQYESLKYDVDSNRQRIDALSDFIEIRIRNEENNNPMNRIKYF